MGKINILELNQIVFKGYRELVSNPKSLFMCYLEFIIKILYSIVKFSWGCKKVTAPLLFIEPSLNNQKTLAPIYANFNEKDYILVKNHFQILPRTKIYFLSFIYSFKVLALYYKMNREDKKIFRFFYSEFLLCYGFYKTTDEFIRKNKNIKLIVFANDHIMRNRCLIELSQKYGIKTLYTQHASVTEHFPCLNFTYSFLDGILSLNEYKKAGNIKGKVFLSGSPRFDALETIHKKNKKFIGIALNALDNIDLVFNLCVFLKDCKQYVILRPHPSLENMNWNNFIKNGIKISFPSKENSFEFISKIKLLVANESGIHLDAALSGTPSVLYNFSNNVVMDWYSYIKNGLIEECQKQEDVIKLIDKVKEIDITKTSQYNAAFGTKYQGNVGVLISHFIKSIQNNHEEKFINLHFKYNKNLNCFYYKQ